MTEGRNEFKNKGRGKLTESDLLLTDFTKGNPKDSLWKKKKLKGVRSKNKCCI